MKIKIRLLSMIAATLLAAGCGGSGGGDSTPAPTPDPGAGSVSGVVADGYLVGAKVFSDRNGNKKWDDGEPFTQTLKGGTYQLEGEDLNKYPLVVEVTTTVIDEDTGEAVGKPYVLSAPIGKPEFISPITTLVQARVEKDGLTIDEAETAIQTQLGTSADLFSDYIETGGTPSEDQKNLRKVAQVVANAFGEFQAQIETKVNESDGVDLDEDYGAIIAIVVQEVEAKLTQIVAAVEKLQDDTVIPTDVIDSIVDDIDDDLADIDIEKEVEQTTAPKVSALSVLDGEGVYYLDIDSYWNGTTSINYATYGIVTGNTTDGLTEIEYKHDEEGVWYEDTENGDETVLGPSGWVTDSLSDATLKEESDGSVTITSPNSGTSTRLSITEIALAGKTMGSVVGDEASAFLKNSEAVFPEGAKTYRVRGDVLQDEYELDSPILGLTSLDNIADPNRRFACGPGLEFAMVAGGAVKFYNSQTDSLLLETGTWKEITVSGQRIVEVSIPDALRNIADYDENEAPIFAEYKGSVWHGEHDAPCVEFENNFNKTAFDAINGNIDFAKLSGESGQTTDTSIMGSWILYEGPGMRNVLTFIDDTRYIIIHEHDDSPGEAGSQTKGSVEYGNYTWDTATADFSVTLIDESDGWGGLYDGGSSVTSAAVLNNTLTLHIVEDEGGYDVNFTRVPNPVDTLVGSYVIEEPGGDNVHVLTVLSDSEYVLAHTDNTGEFGTYSYVGTTFDVTSAPVNTDLDRGLYDGVGSTYTVTTQSGNLHFSDGVDENFTFTRIVNIPEEAEAAAQLLTELKNLVEATPPVDTGAIAPYLHENFLHSDCTKAGFIEWCQSTEEGDRPDLLEFVTSLAEATFVEANQSTGFTSVLMDYGDCTYMELRDYGSGLQLYGNQHLWSADIQTEAFADGSGTNITSVWGLGADGEVFQPGDYILVTGKGFPEDGYKMIQHQFNDPNEEATPGEFTSVCFVEGLQVPELTDAIIDGIGENEKYLFTRYNSIDEPQEAYEVMLRQRPYKSTDSSSFPVITSPSPAELKLLNPGDNLPVTWNLPTGTHSNDITLFIDYTDGTSDRVDIELAENAVDVTFTDIQPNSSLTVKGYGLYIYAEDSSGRTVASGFSVTVDP